MGLKWKVGWPPVRTETAEEIDAETAQYKSYFKPSTFSRFSSASDSGKWSRAATLKKRLKEDLEESWGDEEAMQRVMEHHIQVLMHGGKDRAIAIDRVRHALAEMMAEEGWS